MTDDDGPSGPLDSATLEVLARRARTHPLVLGWGFRPDGLSPRVLELQLDETQYPARVRGARLDVRWFDGGDYTVHNLERHEDGTWECRWDRHPKPNAPREHFHPPPCAASNAEPSPFETNHHLDVLFAALDSIEERIGDLYG